MLTPKGFAVGVVDGEERFAAQTNRPREQSSVLSAPPREPVVHDASMPYELGRGASDRPRALAVPPRLRVNLPLVTPRPSPFRASSFRIAFDACREGGRRSA